MSMINSFFEVEKVQDRPAIDTFDNGVKLQRPEKYSVYRKDNGVCLTGRRSVSDGYTIVQPSVLYDVMSEAANIAGIDNDKIDFISLVGGRKIAFQLKLPGFIIDGSGIERNLSYLDAYDATMSMCAGFSSTNVVCSNTWYAVHKELDSRFRHSRSITERVNAYSQNMLEMLEWNNLDKVLFAQMATIRIDEPIKEKFVKVIAGFDSAEIMKGKNEWSSRTFTIRSNKVNMAKRAIEHETNRFGDTFWGLFNSATYMTTHLQLENKDKNANEHLFVGNGRKVNDLALNFIKREITTI